MFDVTIIYDNPSDIDIINFSDFSNKELFFTYLDINSKLDKSKAYKLKSHWGARKNPFVIISKNDKIEKVFYSEEKNAIDQLIWWATEN